MRRKRMTAIGAILTLAATLAAGAYDSGTHDLSLIAVVAIGGAVLIYFLTPYRFTEPDPDEPEKSWDPSQMEDDEEDPAPTDRKPDDAN
jgi:hypothetical protein